MTNTAWRMALSLMHAIDAINRRVGRAMVWPILGAVLVSAGNALSRKAFDLSSNAMLELQWYLFGLAFLGAAGYVLLVDEHVRVDAVAQYLSSRVRATVDIALLVACVLPLTALIGWLGWGLTAQAWVSGEVSSNAGGLVRWPAYACIPLGMVLLGAQAVAEVVRRAAWLAGRQPAPSRSEDDLPPLFDPAPGGPKVR
jgi:TRAP-type mannitol/chloroaromatic compound transport system permease small subunit